MTVSIPDSSLLIHILFLEYVMKIFFMVKDFTYVQK